MNGKSVFPALASVILALVSSPSVHGQDPPRGGVLARADSLQGAGQIRAAAELVEETIPRAHAAADTCRLGGLLHRRGFYALSGRDPQAAVVALEAAVAFAEACPDSAQWCESLRWLARVYGMIGRLEDSVAPCRKLVEVGTAFGDRVNTGWGHVGLAWVDWRAGRADPALAHYEAAVDQFAGIHPPGEAWALNGIALILDYQGRIDEAMAIYRRNLELARAAGDLTGQAMALNNLGSGQFEVGRPDLAQRHFQEAIEIHRRSGWSQNDFNPLFNMSLCLLDLGRVAEAESTLAEAYRLGRERNDARLMLKTRLEQGELFAWTRRHQAAVRLLEAALADSLSLAPDERVEIYFNLAMALERMGEPAEALARIETAETIEGPNVHMLRSSRLEAARGWVLLDLGRPREALTAFRGAVESTTRMNNRSEILSNAFGLGVAFQAMADTDSALAWYERTVAIWENNREAPEPAAWRAQVGSTGRDVFPALSLLLADRGRLAEAADRIQIYKARTLLERMLGPGKRLADHMAAEEAAAVTMARLQGEILEEGELFLDYYLGRASSLVLAVTPDTLAFARLPAREDLAPRLRAYHSLLKDPRSGSAATVETVGRGLADDLLADFGPLVAASRRVLVSPEGELNLIPFGEWYGPPDGPVWVRVPSAGFLASVRTSTDNDPEGEGIVAVVGTVGSGGARLPGSEREIERLERGFADVRVVRPADGSGDFGTILNGGRVLHIAAHAQTVDKSPWNSAIILDAGDEAVPLRAAAIADLDLGTRLAVLSSCNTAGGRIVSGEGVMGLTSAFFSAGVPTVVASLWAVDDAVTAALMLSFYEELGKGRDVATALAGAQRTIRENAATAHPANWAGFVVAGDGGLTPRVSARGRWLASRTALLVTAVLVVILVWRTRPRRRA